MRRMPSSVRDFTVPSGRPVRVAICDWDRPSKYIKREHVSLLGRKFVQRRSHDAALFGQADLLHDVLGVIGDILDRLGDRILGTPAVGLLAPDQVDGAVVDHAHQPRLHRATLGVVGLRVPPHRHERFLHDLLREM